MNSFYVACFFIIIINFPFFFFFCWYRSLERQRERQREEGRKRRRQSRRRWKKKEKMKGVKTVRKNNQRQCWGGCISSWWYHLGVWPLSQDILPFPRHELPIEKKKIELGFQSVWLNTGYQFGPQFPSVEFFSPMQSLIIQWQSLLGWFGCGHLCCAE